MIFLCACLLAYHSVLSQLSRTSPLSLLSFSLFTLYRAGKVWDDRVHGNAHSYGELYDINASLCPAKLQTIIAAQHDAAWKKL